MPRAPTSTSIRMIVRAATDQAEAVALHTVRQRGGVLHDLLLIGLERRLQRFVETDGLPAMTCMKGPP